MRTNIEIDDRLMRDAMKAVGATTKKAAVEAAMRLTIQLHRQGEAMQKLWGIGWEGNLDEMRRNEHLDWDPAWKASPRSRKSAA